MLKINGTITNDGYIGANGSAEINWWNNNDDMESLIHYDVE